MREYDILKEYNEVNQQLDQLKLISHYREGEELQVIKQQIDDLQIRSLALYSQLQNVEDNQDSRTAKSSIRRQVVAYINHISGAYSGLLISRKQGLSLENHLFYLIARDINQYLYHDPLGGYSLPGLLYTRQPDDGIDRAEVLSFLQSELGHLDEFTSVNYPLIMQYVEQMRVRMKTRFNL